MSARAFSVIIFACLSIAPLAGEVCQIPGYPNAEDVAEMGLPWCPSDVSLQVRSFALQAAGAQCAMITGSSSTPEQLEARRQEIRTACEILAGLGVSQLSMSTGTPVQCSGSRLRSAGDGIPRVPTAGGDARQASA